MGDGGAGGAPTWHWLGLPAAPFHPALQGMRGSARPSGAPTDAFLHPLSVLAAPCQKRKAKQALPSRLVQSRARSQMRSKLSWTRSRSGAVPGSAGEKDGPRPLTGLNFAPSSKPWRRSVQMLQTPPRAALPPSPGMPVPPMPTRESWSGNGPGGEKNGASASR